MKKNLFMVAAVALLAMVACNKEDANNGGAKEPTVPFEFTAYADGAETPELKTTLNTEGDSPKTHWLSTDKISVNGYEFSVDTESEVGANARFLGNLPEGFNETFKAVYPSTAGTFESLTIPATQTANAGDFDAAAVVAVAQSETNTLAFKNVTSLLKFQVPATADFAETVTSVTITSTDALAGTIKINSITTEADVTTIDYTVTSAANTVTVNCAEGFDPAKTYYVAVLPKVKNNFVVRVNGYVSKSVDSANLKRSVVMNMKTLPAPEKCEWGIVGAHQSPTTWNIDSPTPMYKVDENVYAILNMTLNADGFKFAHMTKKTWDNWSFGAWKKSEGKGYFDYITEMSAGSWYGNPLYSNNSANDKENIGVDDFTKKYDIYLKITAKGDWGIGAKYTVVTAGTDVTYP